MPLAKLANRRTSIGFLITKLIASKANNDKPLGMIAIVQHL